MAQNKQQMLFEITGDVTGLRKALSTGTNSIFSFGKEAGGVFGEFSDTLETITGKLTGLSGGFVGVAGAAGVLAGGLLSVINSSNEFVKTYNEVSKASGLTVTELQQLQATFQGVGFDVEKFGDLNRDVLDHLGDAFRDGSGPAADMKAYGINLKNFNQYLNQGDGGVRALAEAFYEMRAKGKSISEITNMMETLGSDGSKLVSTFQQYNNVQDLMNNIQSQNVILSDETAKAYQQFDNNLSILTTNTKLLVAQGLNPLITATNQVFAAFKQDPDLSWTDKLYSRLNAMQKLLSNFFPASIDSNLQKVIDDSDKVVQKMNSLPTQQATVSTPQGGFVDKSKQEAAAKAAAQKRIQAEQNLQNVISQIGISSGDIQIKNFNRQQDEIVKKIKDNAKTLKLSTQDTTSLLTQAYDYRTKKFQEMIDTMLGISDPNSKLKTLSDNIAAVAKAGQLTPDRAKQELTLQDQRIGLSGNGSDSSNPFDNAQDLKTQTDQLNAEKDQELAINAQLNEQLGTSHEDYMKRKQQITEKYNAKILAVETQNTQAQMGLMANAAGSLGTILGGVFGEGSKAAEAAFAVQKGITITQTILSIQSALAQALATPFPASLAAYAQVLSLGASIISTVKGTGSGSSGQFHGGVDSLSSQYDNQSFVLKAGERVVQPSANKSLTAFLDKQDQQDSQPQQQQVINAPLIIQGGGVDDDAKFQSMLKKHKYNVSQAVKDVNQRST
jgi:hypothetical protein